MELRAISEEMVQKTIHSPNRTYLEDDGDTKFIRRVNGVTLHVVCKPVPDQNSWLVKSTWVRGEDDHGNRVDRYGRYLGKAERRAPSPTPRPQASVLINAVLIIILIGLLIVLFYFLNRR